MGIGVFDVFANDCLVAVALAAAGSAGSCLASGCPSANAQGQIGEAPAANEPEWMQVCSTARFAP